MGDGIHSNRVRLSSVLYIGDSVLSDLNILPSSLTNALEGIAAPFSPGGKNPFTPGGIDPLSNSPVSQFTQTPATYAPNIMDRIVNADGSITLTPNAHGQGIFDNSEVSVEGVSTLATSVKDFVTGKTFGAWFTRGGLELIGLIFVIFGFVMLAIRSTSNFGELRAALSQVKGAVSD